MEPQTFIGFIASKDSEDLIQVTFVEKSFADQLEAQVQMLKKTLEDYVMSEKEREEFDSHMPQIIAELLIVYSQRAEQALAKLEEMRK